MFEGLSLTHILLFLVILLLLFGAKRLPEIGGALGKSIGEFKKSMKEINQEVNSTVADTRRLEPPPVQPPAASQPATPPSAAQANNPRPTNN
jgi:sec-independent protein translocase protein TatA